MASHTDDSDEIAGINVTPLVDVVLVLLVIFMITAPSLYQDTLKVQLPQAKTGENQSKQTLQIVVDGQGSISVDKRPMTLDQLSELVARDKHQSAIVLADKKVEHGKVIVIIDTLKSGGVQKFSFGVERP